MELRDIIYSIGISATLIISLFALVINIRNRRNGMREHLYKEQMAFFIALSKELHLLLELYLLISREGELSEALDNKLELAYEKIETIGETYEFITPDEIEILLSKVVRAGSDLHLKTLENPISMKDTITFQNRYYDLTDAMREHMGVDKLSHENRRLSFGKVRLSQGISAVD